MAESWSIEEEKQLQALMAKKVVVQSECKSRGAAMNDGSKRRYVDEESVGSMDNPWIEVTEKSHLKVDYSSVELDLPMGITSLEQWGRTVDSLRQICRSQCHLQWGVDSPGVCRIPQVVQEPPDNPYRWQGRHGLCQIQRCLWKEVQQGLGTFVPRNGGGAPLQVSDLCGIYALWALD